MQRVHLGPPNENTQYSNQNVASDLRGAHRQVSGHHTRPILTNAFRPTNNPSVAHRAPAQPTQSSSFSFPSTVNIRPRAPSQSQSTNVRPDCVPPDTGRSPTSGGTSEIHQSGPHSRSASTVATKSVARSVNTDPNVDIDMAHCQLRGPLTGPLRTRRRQTLAEEHPVWGPARDFQRSMMEIQQTIRRTPGISGDMADKICDSLRKQAQIMNNALRETVDDASEIRIQIDEANMAIMNLRLNESTAQHDVDQMERRIEEQVDLATQVEDRLARYHTEAERDRNQLREQVALIDNADENSQVYMTFMADLLNILRKQLNVRHDIYAEPVQEPSAYEQALAASMREHPELYAEGASRPRTRSLSQPPSSRGSGAFNGQMALVSRHASTPGPLQTPNRDRANEVNGNQGMPPNSSQEMPSRGRCQATDPVSNGFSRTARSRGQTVSNDARVTSNGSSTFASGGNQPFRSVQNSARSNNVSRPVNGRPRVVEESPSNMVRQNQINRNTGPGVLPASNVFTGSHNNTRNGRNISNGNGPAQGTAAYGAGMTLTAPQRPQFGANQYDNRTVVALSRPTIPMGSVVGSIDDDLSRFSVLIDDVFGMTRSWILNWTPQHEFSLARDCAIARYLPKCYSGFTEHQAMSYIRQHFTDNMSRTCLFARVVVDFMITRILTISAWQGFEFGIDEEIKSIMKQSTAGPMTSSNARLAHTEALSGLVNAIVGSERYEGFRETKIQYFAEELKQMLGPILSSHADRVEAERDLRALVGKAWSLSAKTMASRLTFEYRFPDAGSRFSVQSMVAIAPNIDGFVLQAEHWRVQLVITPCVTVRNDTGNSISVHVSNLAQTLLMR